MLEKLISSKQMKDFFETEFIGKTIDYQSKVYNSQTDIQIQNPYSDHKVILSLQSRENQNRETVTNFSNKLIYARDNAHILIPIFLTGKTKSKSGSKNVSQFISYFNGSKQAIKNAGENPNAVYHTHTKISKKTQILSPEITILVQRQDLESELGYSLNLKNYKTQDVHYQTKLLPSNFDDLPQHEQSELLNDTMYQKHKWKNSALRLFPQFQTKNNIQHQIYEKIVKPKIETLNKIQNN